VLPITLQNELFHLLPERALFQPRTRTLFIADLHLGKAETFRAHTIPLPTGATQADLMRLSQALTRTKAKRLVVLGDMLHAVHGRERQLFQEFQNWRELHQSLEIILVRGNHDKGAGDPPDQWKIHCIDAPFSETPFVWSHEPVESERGYVLAGHLHPAVQMTGKGKQRLKLPCFWFRENVGVLPAFTSLSASAVIIPASDDRIYVIAGSAVLKV
jgi:uncharacterized protein